MLDMDSLTNYRGEGNIINPQQIVCITPSTIGRLDIIYHWYIYHLPLVDTIYRYHWYIYHLPLVSTIYHWHLVAIYHLTLVSTFGIYIYCTIVGHLYF